MASCALNCFNAWRGGQEPPDVKCIHLLELIIYREREMTVVCALPLSARLSTNNDNVLLQKQRFYHLIAEEYNVEI